MATLLLQAAGATLGGLFGPVGAIVGRAAGALAGNLIDQSLISGMTTISGAQLSTARIPGAEEGTAINRVYGTVRIGGTLIWATRFEEEVTVERSGSKASGPRVETFSYYANFAIGLCEGPIAGIRRVWADGREIDLTTIEMRLHRGTESQPADPLIEAKQGTGNAPAYRGLAYVVFERLPLDTFGNRIPVLQFEVIRITGGLESRIRGMTLIPGATEHGYSPLVVTEKTGDASARKINRNQLYAASDWEASIDELMAVCPNLERVALVVSWFGTDLRAGACRILPGVEVAGRDESVAWRVSGIARGEAHLISRNDGGPAYGGTPNDASVVAAIEDLRARGLEVYLYPFVMMDIPAGNERPDPYGGGEQAAYPWRGRITCHPAPGRPGTVDQTTEAASQVNDFFGSAVVEDFSVSGSSVTYTGADEAYRRMVLHYALLAETAGGVDGFIIGSELRGLTQLRDGGGDFPAVGKLVALAGDVRSILGASTKLTYGADWSEYFGYHPDDGSGDVFFHLDPLWASDAIDAVGIDNYMPLADFRDDDFTGIQPDGARLADDKAAMKAAIMSGEGFDWYYASDAARTARNRSAITDGLAGKPWVYRYKDIEGWWSHRHYDRTGGAEAAAPSAWMPGMKPVWFTELGCPAIDRGANQPNVFIDRKSSESAKPYFSGGMRSDETQRRFLEARHEWWAGDAAPAGMVDPAHMFVWTWDARAWPSFPENADLFADGENWVTGHWLNGRLGAGTLASVIGAVLEDNGITDYDVSEVSGGLKGYVMGRQASARELIEPLATAMRLDAIDDDGVLRFRSRGLASAPASVIDVLADPDDDMRWSETLGQDGDFAGEAIIDFQSEANEYEAASARSRRLQIAYDRVLRLSLPAVFDEDAAGHAVEGLLRDHRLSRRQIAFAVSPSDITHEPGDVISLGEGPEGRFQILRIEDGAMRRIEAREAGSGDSAGDYARRTRRSTGREGSRAFSPVVHLMDLARYESGNAAAFSVAAVAAKPWRRVALSSSPETENYERRAVVTRPATLGRLTAGLDGGPTAAPDNANDIRVRMIRGELSSVSQLALLNGANRAAVQSRSGAWEIIGFRTAEELESGIWRLSGLLRGLGGTEDATAAGALIDAPFVVLDRSVSVLGLDPDEAGVELNWIAESYGQGGGRAGPMRFAGRQRAETPLAPVHLGAERLGSGDIALRWIRRSRVDADGWDGDDVPFDEDSEAYRLEILDGEDVVRVLHPAETSQTYTEAMELADFGSQQMSISFRVRQKGSRIALGIAAERTVML